MQNSSKTVASVDELLAAASDEGVSRIVVRGTIADAPSLHLSQGQQLVGENEDARILFRPESDGLELTSDNEVRLLQLQTIPHRRAIYNDTSVQTLGTIVLDHVTTIGQVQIIAKDAVHAGHVSVNGLDIIAAHASSLQERPHAYGVHVLQGAFTLWNQQPAGQATLTAELVGISLGREGVPVNGSGVFVCGAGATETNLRVSRLETEAIFVDGKIPQGTADLITGGVFVVYGAHADEVRNHGVVVTYGPNDMVLDNWGDVDLWIAESDVQSHGPSGIGFVNFGTTRTFRALRPVETFGLGARGFNAYDGRIETAEFERIETHANAGVGVQISRPIGHLIVHQGIITHGGVGDSLVKGVITQLPAYGLSIQHGGVVEEVVIDKGSISTEGDSVITVQVQGDIGTLRVSNGISAHGHGSDAIQVEGGSVGLDSLDIQAADGVALRLKDAYLSSLQTVKAHGAAGDVVVESNSQVMTSAQSVEALRTTAGNAFTISGSTLLSLEH